MSISMHRRATILVAGTVFVALVFTSSRLRLDADLSRMIPDADPRVGQAISVARALLERLTIEIAVEDGSDASVDQLAAVADSIVRDLRELGVRECAVLDSESDTLRGVNALRDRAALVTDPALLSDIESRLSKDAIERRLLWLERALQEPEGVGQRAASDPLGISDGALVGLRDAASMFKFARIVNGCIISGDGRRALLLLEPGFPASDVERTGVLLNRIEAIRVAFAEDPATTNIRIRVLGAHRSTLDNVVQISDDAQLIATLGLGLATLFALLVYASIWHVAIALFPALFGAALAGGVFAVVRGSVAGAAVGFGAVLVGLTVDYANHALFGLRARGRIDVSALLTSAATTVAAFLALLWSSLPVVREIGVFGAIGVVGAAACTLWVVPALAGRGASRREPIINLSGMISRLKTNRAIRLMPVAFVLMTPLVVLSVSDIAFDGDVTHLSSLTPSAAADEAAIMKFWESGFRLTWIAAEGRTLAEALDVNDRVAQHLKRSMAAGGVVEFASLTALLPGPREQARRRSLWRAFWTERRIHDLRRDFAVAVARTPFRPDSFEPFFHWLSAEPTPIDAQIERRGPFAGLLRDRIINTTDGFLVTTAVSTRDWSQVRALEQALRSDVPEAIVLNKESLTRRLAGIVGDEMWLLGAIALVAVAVFAWLLMGSISLVIAVVLPVWVALLWTFGVLGWVGIPMSLVNAVFTTFLVGSAVDYSIVLVHGRIERWKTGHDDTAFADASVLLNAGTAGIGFGILGFADHPVLRSIGVTAVVGIGCAWAATQSLAPVLSKLVLRRRGPGGVFRARNAVSTLWTLWVLVSMVVMWIAVERWRTSRALRQAAAINRIHRIGLRVRDGVPFCTTTHIGVTCMSFSSPTVIVANHESYYDGLALGALPVPVAAFVRHYVRTAPLFGQLLRDAGYVVTDQTDMSTMICAGRELIKRGISPIIFPEGTRSRTGELARFRNGAFVLARALGVRVTPVALVNTRSSVRPGTWWVGDFDARIVVLESLDPNDYAEEGGDRRMARAAREVIRGAIRQNWLGTQNGASWRPLLRGLYDPLGPRARRRSCGLVRDDGLIEHIPALITGNERVVVLDCGIGLVVARLALAFPERHIVGVEEQPERLETARAALGGISNVSLLDRFDDVAGWSGPTSVIIDDEAALRPSDSHSARLEEIARFVAVGGRVLMRRHWEAVVHAGLPAQEGWCRIERGNDCEASSTAAAAVAVGVVIMHRRPLGA